MEEIIRDSFVEIDQREESVSKKNRYKEAICFFSLLATVGMAVPTMIGGLWGLSLALFSTAGIIKYYDYTTNAIFEKKKKYFQEERDYLNRLKLIDSFDKDSLSDVEEEIDDLSKKREFKDAVRKTLNGVLFASFATSIVGAVLAYSVPSFCLLSIGGLVVHGGSAFIQKHNVKKLDEVSTKIHNLESFLDIAEEVNSSNEKANTSVQGNTLSNELTNNLANSNLNVPANVNTNNMNGNVSNNVNTPTGRSNTGNVHQNIQNNSGENHVYSVSDTSIPSTNTVLNTDDNGFKENTIHLEEADIAIVVMKSGDCQLMTISEMIQALLNRDSNIDFHSIAYLNDSSNKMVKMSVEQAIRCCSSSFENQKVKRL